MGSFSIWHWLIVLVVVLVLFGGGGKIKKIMGDMGSGITAFKKGLKEEEKKAEDADDDATKAIDDSSTVTRTGEEKDKAVNG